MKGRISSKHLLFSFSLLVLLVVTVLLAVVTTIYNNSIRSSPIFLFLLVLGVGTFSGVGLARGGIFGLLLVSVWITVKQTIGVWSEVRLVFNLLEILAAITSFIISGIYHDRLKVFFDEYLDDKNKLRRLDFEDTATGLIKASIGLLRLGEESARALRYRRPISLVLILIRTYSGISWKPADRISIIRSVATTIKDTTRDADIPFLVTHDKIALILPETNTVGANKVVNNIVSRMVSARFITQAGSSELLQMHTQIRLGFATFFGQSDKRFDLMEAAERSLQKNLETNLGDLFQNLFIDWETIGELPLTQSIITPDMERVFQSMEHDELSTGSQLPAIENRKQGESQKQPKS
jgi:GGDEF domain-containing protein